MRRSPGARWRQEIRSTSPRSWAALQLKADFALTFVHTEVGDRDGEWQGKGTETDRDKRTWTAKQSDVSWAITQQLLFDILKYRSWTWIKCSRELIFKRLVADCQSSVVWSLYPVNLFGSVWSVSSVRQLKTNTEDRSFETDEEATLRSLITTFICSQLHCCELLLTHTEPQAQHTYTQQGGKTTKRVTS